MIAKKILVINTMCIGDLVLCTPLLRVLKNNFTKSYLAVLSNKSNADILLGNPCVDETISLDKKGRHKNISGMLNLIKQIREDKFDLVINLTTSERAFAIAYLSGAKRIISYPPFSKKHSGDVHKVEEHLNLLKKLNLSIYKHNGLEVFPSPNSVKYVENFLAEHKAKSSEVLIGLNPGASWPNKKWSPENFASLADNLMKKEGIKVVFTGGKEDIPLVNEIIAYMDTKPIIATGQTSLQQLAAFLQKCDLVITSDSGPLHIAVGVRTQVIALFGPSSSVIYGPYGKDHRVVKKDLSCSPCSQNKVCSNNCCMKSITVQEVLEVVDEYLKGVSNV